MREPTRRMSVPDGSPRVLVLWSDNRSPNLGVRALGAGTAALVRQVWPRAHIAYQGYGPGDAPRGIGDPKQLARHLARRSSDLREWLATFDLVVDTRSGDSFADIYGLHRLVAMSMVSELVRQARVPIVLGPQTYGPFESARARLLARRSLHTAFAVLARDSVSADAARRLRRGPVELTTDVVFALPEQHVAHDRDVIVNPSGLLWADNPHVDAASYRNTVVELCRRLLRGGRRLTLLAHVLDSPSADNDVPALHSLAAALDTDVELVVPDSLDEARAVLVSANVVVGSRMHACLNALSQRVPAVPLAYSRKFEPLLAGLGWHRTVDLRSALRPVDDVLAALDDPLLASAASASCARAAQLSVVSEQALRRCAG